MIDEKKSLALIGKDCVRNAEEARTKFREVHGLISKEGKFQNSVKVAFFNMDCVNSSVGQIAGDINKSDKKKKQAETDKLEAEEDAIEAEDFKRDFGEKKLQYKMEGRTWEVPQNVQHD